MNEKEADELVAAIWQYIRANPETAFIGNITGTLRFNTTDTTAWATTQDVTLDTTSGNAFTGLLNWGQDNSSTNWRP